MSLCNRFARWIKAQIRGGQEGRRMYKGTVNFRARIKGNGLKIPPCDFNPNEPGIEKIVIESPNGFEIQGTVHLSAVAAEEEARTIAAKLITTFLNRISFNHDTAIELDTITSSTLIPVTSQPGAVVQVHTGDYLMYGQPTNLIHGISAPTLKAELEQGDRSGERLFGLFRSALLSEGLVERFMHLYQILLLLFNDNQRMVDEFIRQEEPTVLQTPSPKYPGVMETIYSRLRNEFGHARLGVNIYDTKVSMVQIVDKLATLTKRAIELHP